LEEAEAQYLEACRLAPRRADFHNKLGVLYVRQGHISQALLQFGQAVAIDPNDTLAMENLRRAQAMDLRVDSRLVAP
jgi:Flp pilus assembly protein TadD